MQDERMPEALCQRLGDFIAQNTGLHFPPERHLDLQRAIASAAQEFGFPDSAGCARWLLSAALSAPQLNTLASHLTVGETYFFREQRTFDALAQHVLPELLRERPGQKRRLRLWSAACCTGEEPYSVAILLEQLLGEAPDWNVTLLATDINERFLQKAAAGIYSEWSFRETRPGLKERYFTRSAGGRYAIRPEIRRRVRFTQLNLARDAFPSLETDTAGMDVILCRNALMYFTPAQQKDLIARLHRTLVDDGWLVVGASECSQALFAQFASVPFEGCTLYRKRPAAESPAFATFGAQPARPGVLPTVLPPAVEPLPAEVASAQPPLEKAPAAPPPVSDPSSPAPQVQSFPLQARALANEGRFAEALARSERWIAADKVNPGAHYLHAMILQEMGDLEAARQSLHRALYLQPDLALAHFALGNLARAGDRDAEAHRHFRNALRVLRPLPPEEPLVESEGMTAGRLAQVIDTLLTLSDEPRVAEVS